MPIITFISDFGTTDHYVASVKGSVLKYNPNNKIVDISHEVNKYDLSHAAYIFKNIYMEFPQGSVHIIGVNNSDDDNKIILFQLNNQYVITFDTDYRRIITTQLFLYSSRRTSHFLFKSFLYWICLNSHPNSTRYYPLRFLMKIRTR